MWEGAEGGGSTPPQFDDSRGEDLPGPKFKSLRHLRQVSHQKINDVCSLQGLLRRAALSA